MDKIPSTENESLYTSLEQMSTAEIISSINQEDEKASLAVKEVISEIELLINAIFTNMSKGGRLFYIGAGLLVLIII